MQVPHQSQLRGKRGARSRHRHCWFWNSSTNLKRLPRESNRVTKETVAVVSFLPSLVDFSWGTQEQRHRTELVDARGKRW